MLDYCEDFQAFETFANLNRRFHQLVVHSSLPLHLNFDRMSKETFQQRCNSILMPQRHRLFSLRLSHHLPIDHFFSSFAFNALFVQLRTLVLNQIKSDHLVSVLNSCSSLPRLSSLVARAVEQIRSPNDIFSAILRLPVLTFCKISLDVREHYFDEPVFVEQYSPLERLIIDAHYNLDDLIELLAFTPHIQVLSTRIFTLDRGRIELFVVPKSLTNVCLKLERVSFDEFEWFISSFSDQLRVLRIVTENEIGFLDAHRWEKLISQRMSRLDRFDFQHQVLISGDLGNLAEHFSRMELFRSSFFTDRKWFFTYKSYRTGIQSQRVIFYSTRPYR